MPINPTPDDASAFTPLTTTTTTTPTPQSPLPSCDRMTGIWGFPSQDETNTLPKPFRYSNGEIKLSETDLSFSGLGFNWAHTRSYDNILSYVYLGPAGNCWFVSQMPFLQLGSGTPTSTITLVSAPTARLAYTRDGATNNYLPKFFQRDTIVYDATNHQYIFTRTDGQKQIFNSSGKLQRVVSAGGQIMTATYSGSNIASLLTTAGGSSTGFIYSYVSGTQRLSSAVLQISGVAQRRALYTYYGSADPNGMSGDLRTVEIQQWNGTTWQSIKTSYYRYYTTNAAPGIQHGLKYLVSAQAYANMVAVSLDPLTATDAEVAQYADNYFEYDGTRRVTKEVVKGGTSSYSVKYLTKGTSTDFNTWVTQTTEMLPDGCRKIVYSNSYGQALFKIHASSREWFEMFEYDGNGNFVRQISSSAIDSSVPTSVSPGAHYYSNSNVAVGVISATRGLITSWQYYNGTDGPKGYVKSRSIQQGSAGTPILQQAWTYVARTAGGQTIYKIASETTYQSETGDGAPATTTYDYTWYPDTLQVQQMTTTLPVVTETQNGSGTADSWTEYYDSLGNVTWRKDERGVLTYRAYDPVSNAVTQEIRDVNTSLPGSPVPPTGWDTTSGRNLVTDYQNDVYGRETQSLGPIHKIDVSGTATDIRRARWTVYDDVNFQVRTGAGYASGTGYTTFTLVNPVNIQQADVAKRTIAQIQATRASTVGKLLPSDTFPQSAWTRWSSFTYDPQTENFNSQQDYFLIPASGIGAVGANYNRTSYGYDSRGRLIRTVSPGGTITRQVVGTRGLVFSTWIGTDDTGATFSDPTGGGASGNNMVQVSTNTYDDGFIDGDGNLTALSLYASASDTRITQYGYDFRNRRISSDGEIDFYESYIYDNADRLIQTDRRNTTAGGTLIGRSTQAFDNLGREYELKRYAVNPSTGTVGNALSQLTWYDPSGNVIKTRGISGRGFKKTTYDGLGWITSSYVACDPDPEDYSQAGSVNDDWVLQQTDFIFDAAGNVIFTAIAERNHDATGTGRLNGPSGSQPQARINYACAYPDGLGRIVAVANYGTNGGTTPSRPSIIPASTDTVLVNLSAYNEKGELYQTTEPEEKVTQQTFDALDRVVETIGNYRPGETGPDKNQTSQFVYNPDGNLTSLTVLNSVTGDQVTTWEYGTTLADSAIANNGLLRAKEYPDGGRIENTYNRLSQPTTVTDPRGSVRSFDYDKLGRSIHDRVTTLGSGVDGSVRRRSQGYDSRGLTTSVTSWDDASVGSGSVVNEIVSDYNDFRQLQKDYQSLSGAKGGSTPFVEYSYADGSDNTARRTSIIYPDGRVIGYVYASGIDDLTDRISEITDSLTTGGVATYARRGINSTVQINYTQPGIEMSYIGTPGGDGGDQYVGLDRFNRIIDIPWTKSGADLAHYEYGFSRASNRLWREDVVGSSAGYDEAYTYDGLYQLSQRQRGTLSVGVITGTPAAQEDFGYDPIGNWNDYETMASGTPQLDQSRVHNTSNEITQIDGSATLLDYDPAGNMTKTPRPANWSVGWVLTWDAWNRLMSVSQTSGSVRESYAYDGLSRRTVSFQAGLIHRGYFYSDQWQVLEERPGSGSIGDSAVRQYVWGLRYIDDLILRDVLSEDEPAPPGRLYVLHDQWHVVAVTNESGVVKERYSYSAFGITQVLDPNYGTRSASNYGWNITYGAYRWDEETGFYQVRYRYYQPSLGRWLSRDPIEEYADKNIFSYVHDGPTKAVDVYGLEEKRDCDFVIIGKHTFAPGPKPGTYQSDFIDTLAKKDIPCGDAYGFVGCAMNELNDLMQTVHKENAITIPKPELDYHGTGVWIKRANTMLKNYNLPLIKTFGFLGGSKVAETMQIALDAAKTLAEKRCEEADSCCRSITITIRCGASVADAEKVGWATALGIGRNPPVTLNVNAVFDYYLKEWNANPAKTMVCGRRMKYDCTTKNWENIREK